MASELPTYDRASIEVRPHVTALKTKPTGLSRAANEMGPYVLWDIYSVTQQFEHNSFISLMSCENEEKGPASLYTTSLIKGSSETCLTTLIKDGVVYPAGVLPGYDQGQIFTICNTQYTIPETVFNGNYNNDLLPRYISTEPQRYFQYISPLQIPKSRNSDLARTFRDLTMKDVGEEFNDEGGNAYVTRQMIASSYVNVDIGPGESSSLTNALMNSATYLNTSSRETRRVLSYFRCPKSEPEEEHSSKKPKKSIFENIPKRRSCSVNNQQYPLPVSQCTSSTLYNYFKYVTGKDISEECSYMYNDDQFELFRYGTNHVFTGRLVGGMVGALYLDGIGTPTRDMFYKYPAIEYFVHTPVHLAVFACLYPPEDPEYKKYCVCVSALAGSYYARHDQVRVSLDKETFICYSGDGNRGSVPYCVMQIPFSVNCNSSIKSYVKYLPSKSGEMVDVEATEVNVFTQVKLFCGFQILVNDVAVKNEYADKIRLILGTPKYEGDVLDEFNMLNIGNRVGQVDNDYVVREWKPTGRANGFPEYVGVSNDFSQLIGASCTPADYTVVPITPVDEKPSLPVKPRDRLILLQEAVHKANR